jgi:serine/threonine protein kinase
LSIAIDLKQKEITIKKNNEDVIFKILNNYEIFSIEEIEIKKKIGNGRFSDIFLINYNNKEYALKKLLEKHINSERYLVRFLHEMQLMGLFNHPNIINLNYCYKSYPNFYILMEYMNYGSLYEIINDHNIKLSKANIISISIQIAKGMNYLHNFKSKYFNNLIHGDLKSANILADKNLNIKICDFNFTNEIESYKKFEPHGVFTSLLIIRLCNFKLI